MNAEKKKYKVMPLIYAANESFKNPIRFELVFIDKIEREALMYAASAVQRRYPYFSVCLEREGEEYVLAENDRPFTVTAGGEAIMLNSPQSNGHLLAFAYDDNRIYVDISHFICDGNGLIPMVKTLAYYYIERRYGAEGIDTSKVRLVTDEVDEGEYAFPIPDSPLPNVESFSYSPKDAEPLLIEALGDEGDYAYHLQIRQSDMMKYARGNDGSPVSMINVVLFKALTRLYPDNKKDVVCAVAHEYRKAIGRPLSHESLTRVMYTRLSPDYSNESIDKLNTIIRGQIALGCDSSLDVSSFNGLVQLNAYLKTMPLEAKKQMLSGLVKTALGPNTFGLSYTGNISWGGMERYIKDVSPYAGETDRKGGLSIEVFTIGEYFTLCMMMAGRHRALIDEVIRCFEELGVGCVLTDEGGYRVPDYGI